MVRGGSGRWGQLLAAIPPLLGLVGCVDDDDDCLQPKSSATSALISDCAGTFCETDADCPGNRRCMKNNNGSYIEHGIPIGCRLPPSAGSCVVGAGSKETCFTVTSPSDYDVSAACDTEGGVYSTEACDDSKYAQKCTEMVASGSGKPANSATYVRYYADGAQVTCSGTLQDL